MGKVQLIVLGYAGSEALNFNSLQPYFGNDVILSVVEYKGRGARRKEKYYKNCEEMVMDIALQIEKIRNLSYPYAILGYSMGAQNVYELFAQGLIKEMPICTFVAAHEPPNIPCAGKKFSLDDEQEFIEHIKIYGGIDERLLKEPRFAQIYISRMRADFFLLQEYCFSGEYYKFPTRFVVFYCEQDTPFELVQDWQKFVLDKVHFYELGSNHFFFRTCTAEFCRIILNELEVVLLFSV